MRECFAFGSSYRQRYQTLQHTSPPTQLNTDWTLFPGRCSKWVVLPTSLDHQVYTDLMEVMLLQVLKSQSTLSALPSNPVHLKRSLLRSAAHIHCYEWNRICGLQCGRWRPRCRNSKPMVNIQCRCAVPGLANSGSQFLNPTNPGLTLQCRHILWDLLHQIIPLD